MIAFVILNKQMHLARKTLWKSTPSESTCSIIIKLLVHAQPGKEGLKLRAAEPLWASWHSRLSQRRFLFTLLQTFL